MKLKTILQHLSTVKDRIDTGKSMKTEAKSPGSPIKERVLENGPLQSEKILVRLHPMPCYTHCLATAHDKR